MPRVGKPPPQWFEILLAQNKKETLTRSEIAALCDISINAVNKAFQRYKLAGNPALGPNGAPIIIYEVKELKKVIAKISKDYEKQ